MREAIFALAILVSASPGLSQPALTDRTFEISGLSMHIRCGGERRPGAPLVVMEAGAANSADTWRDVHASIATFARACAYDRPAMGTSTTPKEPLSVAGYTQLLTDVLRAAREGPPYVIVGHSIGGVMAAMFAHAHPRDVAGLVLVDSSHPSQVARWRTAQFTQPQAPPPSPTGTTLQMPEPLPVGAFIDALGETPWRGTIPLAVLSRGVHPSSGDPLRIKLWDELQRDWATRSPNARHIIASKSGHYIHNDEPALVIEAVRWVVDQAAKR